MILLKLAPGSKNNLASRLGSRLSARTGQLPMPCADQWLTDKLQIERQKEITLGYLVQQGS